MKKIISLFIISVILSSCVSIKSNLTTTSVKQQNHQTKTTQKRPKLVVGIVIDQMRYDYLVKFYNKFGEGGFKRLLNNGYDLKNAHFNYIPTYTAVGHTSIYTGTTPTNHGIISNNWYDKYQKKSIYCVDDANYKTVGATKGGNKSPQRMLTTTITDQVKLAQNMHGKTIGIALKDRASILPAGHTANAAYWFEGKDVGKFITSTFYMNKLPQWVVDFNNSGKANNYLNGTWNTYNDISTYTESLPDNNKYEGLFRGKHSPTFPYNLKELRKINGNYDLLKAIPQGNSITTDFAEAAIVGENLGKTNYTDFLAISYSSTDYVGHKFGTNAIELEDTYIRLDKEIQKLLTFLDEHVGKGNYTLFLTADHAAVPNPSYLEDLKIPSGYFKIEEFKKYVRTLTLKYFNSDKIVENISNYQLFLNKEKIKSLGLDVNKVEQIIADEIINFDKVYKSVTAHTLQTAQFSSGLLQTIQKGYNQKFSGDILFVPMPGVISHGITGTTHGSGYNYDTHVPLIFYGKGIKTGSSNVYYPITNIAPTISSLLNIEEPDGCTGRPIIEVLK
ncbi:alkaline phosphatase PafA [Lutibacter sp.]|uniref:alkaline phosphatase PafA n=1 Tax=Lutibacter sp. TaxID=1925666 RepID=UPI0025BCEC04|nr:alkaline phosphatase PafA [Lutibacter sp.]MCF6182008.1 alkaline phosphatase family protein [Lutibacter sp.]